MSEQKQEAKTAGIWNEYGRWILAAYVVAVLAVAYYMDSIVSKLGVITRLKH